MKGKDVKNAKINRIFTAIGCLAVALALAAFSCFAWFASNNKVQNDLTAAVSSGNITDLTVHYYSLTGKTESGGTTTYTVYKDLGEEEGEGAAIGAYGSTESTATLIKVSYTVKDGTTTQIIFAGSGAATFPATLETRTVNGVESSFYTTYLSNAVSLRLTDSNSYGTITPQYVDENNTNANPTTISTSKTAQTFCDVSELSGSEEQTIDETNIAFTNIDGTQNAADGYYYITEYIVMEYSDDNVIALYPSSGVNYSIPLSCSKDITLAVKDNSASTDVDTGGSSEDDGGSTETATVSSVTISGDTTVEAGSTIDLSASVTMSDSSTYSGTISWSSSDTGVATVSGGTVTGVATGTATITATADGVSGEYTITVTAKSTSTTAISVAKTADEIVTATGLTTSSNSVSATTYAYEGTDGTKIALTSGVGIDTSTSTYSYSSVSCSYRIKTNGTGSTSKNSIELTLVEGATITVYAKSGSSSEDRTLNLLDSSGNVVSAGSAQASMSAYTEITYTVSSLTSDGIYYLASASSGINIIYISIAYSS